MQALSKGILFICNLLAERNTRQNLTTYNFTFDYLIYGTCLSFLFYYIYTDVNGIQPTNSETTGS